MKNYLFFLLILLAPCVHAQKPAIVSGVLRDAQSGETLIGATVQAPSLSIGNYSNEYGFYSLSLPVSEDSIELVFSYIGFETISRKVKPVGEIKLDIALSQIGTLIDEVVIKANALEDKMRSTEMSVTTLTSKEIKAVPVLFGESDILKILQLKPGFTPGSEGTTGLFVRGGNSDQNLIVLDEAVVYNPNHLFGFFSTFNSDAVKDLKVYKGGFPAQYGGRLSSVIDVRMKEGNNKKFTGSGGIGLIASRLTLEAPFKRINLPYDQRPQNLCRPDHKGSQ
ncbi:MAG: TonB-dependent receptor [Saprospiraceae bacterium]